MARVGERGRHGPGGGKGTAMDMDIWTYRQTIGPTQGRDLTGYKVEAADGSIGKVDEATYDLGTSYVVVDTGPWIFGKKVMLPAGTIDRIDSDDERVYVDRTKDEIKNAPEFDPDRYREDIYRDKVGGYYTGFYGDR
jgi:PRC-barrel domain protein